MKASLINGNILMLQKNNIDRICIQFETYITPLYYIDNTSHQVYYDRCMCLFPTIYDSYSSSPIVYVQITYGSNFSNIPSGEIQSYGSPVGTNFNASLDDYYSSNPIIRSKYNGFTVKLNTNNKWNGDNNTPFDASYNEIILTFKWLAFGWPEQY